MRLYRRVMDEGRAITERLKGGELVVRVRKPPNNTVQYAIISILGVFQFSSTWTLFLGDFLHNFPQLDEA